MGVRASLERRRLAAGERLCASSVRQLGQSHRGRRKLSTMLEAQKLFLFLGRCIGVGPPPLLLLLANAGYDGDSHYVHLGVDSGGTNLKLGHGLTVEPQPLVEIWTARTRLLSVQSSQAQPAGPSDQGGWAAELCGLALLRSRAFNRLVRVPSALLLDRCHQSRLLERHVVSLLAE